MRTKLVGVAAITALFLATSLSVVRAADMPVKAPPSPPPVVATDWSGIYFDVDVGWEQQRINWLYTNATPPFVSLGSSPFSGTQSGGVMGGHIGVQVQWAWLVVGGEWGGSGLMDNKWVSIASTGGPTAGTSPCVFAPFNAGTQCQMQVGDLMTVGGKLGVAWQDWLLYAVGGGAWGTTRSQILLGPGPLASVSDTANPNGISRGYYVGGGFDYMFAKTRLFDMIAGVEYQHIDLGTNNQLSSLGTPVPFTVGNEFNRNISPKEDIVWAKLTVKFNPFAP